MKSVLKVVFHVLGTIVPTLIVVVILQYLRIEMENYQWLIFMLLVVNFIAVSYLMFNHFNKWYDRAEKWFKSLFILSIAFIALSCTERNHKLDTPVQKDSIYYSWQVGIQIYVDSIDSAYCIFDTILLYNKAVDRFDSERMMYKELLECGYAEEDVCWSKQRVIDIYND